MSTQSNPRMKTFQCTGTLPGYPYGVTRHYDCETIEEAHDLAEGDFEEVVTCKEINLYG